MDEMTNVSAIEDTTPTEQDNVNNEANNVDVAPQTETEIANDSQEAANDEGLNTDNVTVPTISVRVNHENKDLTMEEAVTYAQKGFKYDSLKNMLDDLAYLAAESGKTEADFVRGLIQSKEDEYRQSLIDRYGDDDEIIDVMMSDYKSKNKSKLEAAIATKKQNEEEAEKSLNSRIADDFLEFKNEFPEFDSFEKLPKEVQKSVFDGKDILTAYMHYKHKEEKKAVKAAETQKSNSANSTGSMKSTPEEHDSLFDAFMSGFNR